MPGWAPPTGELGKLSKEEFFAKNPYAEWYLNSLRTAGSPTAEHHRETYGADHATYADAHWRELIERYQPAVLWNDIRYPKDSAAVAIIADYYNAQPDGLVNDRWRVVPADFSTPEYHQYADITSHKWESCRGIGFSFGYNRAEGPEHMIAVDELVDTFVDIVSKNGNLLLNVGPMADGPMADGTIPPLQLERLRGLGRWLGTNGPALFGTRPWLDAEGELVGDATPVRFTYQPSQDALFAILLREPATREITFAKLHPDEGAQIRLLGHDGALEWRRVVGSGGVTITLPADLPSAPAYTVEITPQPSRLLKLRP